MYVSVSVKRMAENPAIKTLYDTDNKKSEKDRKNQ